MSSPERPRAQAARPVQVEKTDNRPNMSDVDPDEFNRIVNDALGVPTVVDGKAQAPKTPSDTHDDIAMLERTRTAIKDYRHADRVAAQVYSSEEAAGRQAQIGAREALPTEDIGAGGLADTFDPGAFPDDDEPIALEAGPWLDSPTEITPLDQGLSIDTPTVRTLARSSVTAVQPPVIERVSSRQRQAEASPASRTPVTPGSIGDIGNLMRTSRAAAPKRETITIAPELPATNWLGKKAQAALDTAKRWGSRLAIFGSLFTQPEPQKPITVPQPVPEIPEEIVPVPQAVELPAPFVANAASPENVPVIHIQQPRLSEPVPSQRVVAPPDNLPVAAPHRNDSKQPERQTVVATEEGVGSMQIEPAAPPTPVVPANVDIEMPKTVTPVVEVPVAPDEAAKQMNTEMSKGALSPEQQIDYVKTLFDSLDSSKVFIRLSPTKRLELRQSASGDIVARFPGEKDFRSLTPEDVLALGKDLSRQPHYTR